MASPRPAPGKSDGFRRRWYHVRLLVLLLLLLAAVSWRAWVLLGEGRPVDWSRPHPVLVCPIAAPGADPSRLAGALASAPADLEEWFSVQAERHFGRRGRPFSFTFAEPVAAALLPPALPRRDEGFVTRYESTRAFLAWFRSFDRRFPALAPDGSRLYLLLHTGQADSSLAGRESVGTRRGRLAVVFASDDPAWWGNALAVIAHETLHTVGALDHRAEDGTIAHPDGYAEPAASPLWPQRRAEVMALGIPVSVGEELLVDALDQVVLGPATAREIGWLTGG